MTPAQPGQVRPQDLEDRGRLHELRHLCCTSSGAIDSRSRTTDRPQWQKWVLDEDKALPLLKAAFDKGLNTWDTADFYADGESERIVGKAIQKYNIPREQLVVMSKCYFTWDSDAGSMAQNNNSKWVNRCGLSRKHIIDAVNASCERLGTYIDVLQIHRLDRETPMEEIMSALDDVVKSGKVRYIGASSMYAWEFQALQNIAEKNGWTKFVSMQNYLNLLVSPPSDTTCR